jgi:hypothetical protein
MTLGSAQPLTEMSTWNLAGNKGRPARKADVTAICEPIVYKMLELRRLTTPMELHGLLQRHLYLLSCLVNTKNLIHRTYEANCS